MARRRRRGVKKSVCAEFFFFFFLQEGCVRTVVECGCLCASRASDAGAVLFLNNPPPPSLLRILLFTHRELGLPVTLLGGSSRLGCAWSRSTLASVLRIRRFPTAARGLRKLSRPLGYPLFSRRGAVTRPVPRLAAFETRTAATTPTPTREPGGSRGSGIGHRA